MKFTMLAVVMLLSASIFGQDSIENRVAEATAGDRLTAAERYPIITSQQCVADLASWESRNQTDVAVKVTEPNYWYEKLSTEELAKLSKEAFSCQTISTEYSVTFSKMSVWSDYFQEQVYLRAEAVLRSHGLIHELLLETSH
jgi:hypothetical protein